MIGTFNSEDSFNYWIDGGKYPGTFKIKWLFIKDIAFNKIEEKN